jgi:hypothetical protein
MIGAAAVAIALVGMGISACRGSDATVERCDNSDDCKYLEGTLCIDGMCTCIGIDYQYCEGICKPEEECLSGSGGGGGGSGGSGGGGGMSGGKCETAADCPQPGDPHCGQAACENGTCDLTFVPVGKLASQIRGDCKHLWCDGFGNLIAYDDGGDTFNDGAECTSDVCEVGNPKNVWLAQGSMCPKSGAGAGVCFEGECVTCYEGGVNLCGAGYACDGVHCVPLHCVNNLWDQANGETAKNCGGPCRPCDPGADCKVPSDCLFGVCKFNTCQAPTCFDGVRNDLESGIDCGGLSGCIRCGVKQGCRAPSDCMSGVCWAGVCEAPSCTDGIKNGEEEDWDCGGPCPPCPN